MILCIQLHMSSTVQCHCECTCRTVVCVTLHTYMQHCDTSHCTYVSLYTCIMDLDVSLCVSTVLDSGVHRFVRLFLQALVCVTFVPKYPGVCQLTFLHTLVCVTFVPTNPGVCQTYISAYPGVRHFVFTGLNLMCVAFRFSIYIYIYRTVMHVTLCSSTCMILMYITLCSYGQDSDVCHFVLLAGQPLKEPVVQYGKLFHFLCCLKPVSLS